MVVGPEVVERHKHLEEVHHIQPVVARCVLLLLLSAFHDGIDFDFGYCFDFDHGHRGSLGPGDRH